MRLLKNVFMLMAVLTLVILAGTAVLIFNSLEPTSAVPIKALSAADSDRYADIAATTGDTNGLLTIQDKQLGYLLRSQLARMDIPSNVDILFSPEDIRATATVRLPINIRRRYLNIQILAEQASAPEHVRIVKLQAGAVNIPLSLVRLIQNFAITKCTRDLRCRSALNSYRNIESVEFGANLIRVRYSLGADTFRLLGKTDIDDLELDPYQAVLDSISIDANGKNVKLHDALQKVMLLASQRSQQGDPVKENAAALLALAVQDADRRVQDILVSSSQSERPKTELMLKVHQRRDLAQHFVSSAALYLIGGTEFSDYVGIYKEVYDVSRGKSFGTGDLIADRAGVRFAQHATSSRRQALDLQQSLLSDPDSSGYLLNKQLILQFEKQYSVKATDEIGAIVTVIDAALKDLPLLN